MKQNMETINLKDLLKVAETGFFITNPEKVDETEIQVKIKNFSVYKRKLLKQLLVKISLMELGLDYESANKSKRNYIKKLLDKKLMNPIENNSIQMLFAKSI